VGVVFCCGQFVASIYYKGCLVLDDGQFYWSRKASVAGQKFSTIVEIFTAMLFIGFGVKLLFSAR
jgi:threonine/homoserine/homoserine lactone efflux protein